MRVHTQNSSSCLAENTVGVCHKTYLVNPLNAELNPICHLLILFGDLTFMSRCIVSIFQKYPTRYNVTQFIYIWRLLYIFRVVLSPIIRSAYTCIYSIWYLSQRYCYLPLSWKSWNRFGCAVGGVRHPQHTQTGVAADSSNGVTNNRCCRYSCMRSWWWAEVPLENCRAVSRYK
jgi:hypothetical protein